MIANHQTVYTARPYVPALTRAALNIGEGHDPCDDPHPFRNIGPKLAIHSQC